MYNLHTLKFMQNALLFKNNVNTFNPIKLKKLIENCV